MNKTGLTDYKKHLYAGIRHMELLEEQDPYLAEVCTKTGILYERLASFVNRSVTPGEMDLIVLTRELGPASVSDLGLKEKYLPKRPPGK
jgi:hypothetical protein